MVCLLAVTATSRSSGLAQSAPGKLPLSIRAEQTTVRKGLEAKVEIVLTNTTDHLIEVSQDTSGHGEFNYTILVSRVPHLSPVFWRKVGELLERLVMPWIDGRLFRISGQDWKHASAGARRASLLPCP